MSHPADSFSKDEGYYASMADLMAGMLFIFIIVAMVFALDVRKDRVDAVAEAEAKAEARVKAELDVPATPLDRPSPADTEITVRARLIETIRDFLASRGIQVESAPREGLLRLPAGQYFAAKGASLLPAGQTMISHLGEALGRWLPCLATGAPPPSGRRCDRGSMASRTCITGTTSTTWRATPAWRSKRAPATISSARHAIRRHHSRTWNPSTTWLLSAASCWKKRSRSESRSEKRCG